MSPSAVSSTPSPGVQASELTASAVAQKIGASANLQPLDASKLIFTKTQTPMAVPEPGDPIIATSSQCTDHMITAVWDSTVGWHAPKLQPYGNLSLPPTASVLHYATECFEGMKMYRGYDGKLRLFRPDANCKRMVSKDTTTQYVYPCQSDKSPARFCHPYFVASFRSERAGEANQGHDCY